MVIKIIQHLRNKCVLYLKSRRNGILELTYKRIVLSQLTLKLFVKTFNASKVCFAVNVCVQLSDIVFNKAIIK